MRKHDRESSCGSDRCGRVGVSKMVLRQGVSSAVVASCQEFELRHPKALEQAAEIMATAFPQVVKHRQVDARFPDGEAYAELAEFEKGTPVFLFQTLVGDNGSGPDASLFSLMVAARAYKQFGAGQVTAVVPFLAYARQDRQIPGERRPTTSRLVADLFDAAGIDQVLAIQSGSSFNLLRQFGHPSLQQLSFVKFLERCAGEYDRDKTILMAPDAGALPDVQKVVVATGHQFISAEKLRLGPEAVTLRIDQSTGNRRFAHALILDDLVSSAGTVNAAVEELRQIGITSFSVAAPHCQLTQTGRGRLQEFARNGELICFHTTDTIPVNWQSNVLNITPFMTAFSAELKSQFSRWY